MSRLLTRSSWGECAPPPGTPLDLSHPLNQGVVYAWPLNERGGNLIHSCAKGQRAPGVSTGSGPDWSYQPDGYTLSSVRGIKLTDYTKEAVPFSDYGTMSVWHINKSASWGSISTPIYSDNGAFQFGINLYSNGNIYFGCYHMEVGYRGSTTSGTYMSINRWHHILYTWTPSLVQLFIDGIWRANGSGFSAFYLSSFSNTVDLYCGLSQTQTSAVKNLRMWDRVLSPTEIQQLYSDPWAGYALSRSPMLHLPDAPTTSLPRRTWAGWNPRCL